MRRRLLDLLRTHGEEEVTREVRFSRPGPTQAGDSSASCRD